MRCFKQTIITMIGLISLPVMCISSQGVTTPEVDTILCDIVKQLQVPSVFAVGEVTTPKSEIVFIRDVYGNRMRSDPGGVASFGVDHCNRFLPGQLRKNLRAMQPSNH